MRVVARVINVPAACHKPERFEAESGAEIIRGGQDCTQTVTVSSSRVKACGSNHNACPDLRSGSHSARSVAPEWHYDCRRTGYTARIAALPGTGLRPPHSSDGRHRSRQSHRALACEADGGHSIGAARRGKAAKLRAPHEQINRGVDARSMPGYVRIDTRSPAYTRRR